jgi:hypothetical protein
MPGRSGIVALPEGGSLPRPIKGSSLRWEIHCHSQPQNGVGVLNGCLTLSGVEGIRVAELQSGRIRLFSSLNL